MTFGFLINWIRFDRWTTERKELIAHIFDAAMFAGSVVLLAGLIEPTVLQLVGTTKPFLLIAGFAGCAYTIKALFPPRH